MPPKLPAATASVSASARTVPVKRSGEMPLQTDDDLVAVEEPLEIRLNWLQAGERIERNVAVTMRTPGNDAELALGFLFTEGVIRTTTDVLGIAERETNVVSVELAAAPESQVFERNFYITSSCGVCGKASIAAIRANESFPGTNTNFSIRSDLLHELPAQLQLQQSVFQGTGSIHAAALFTAAGLSGSAYEDVGRHNAVDKLLGNAYQQGALPLQQFGVLVSGRASFELVQKARMAGCLLLASVGAPSSLAIDLAWDADMTLIGFLRDGRYNIYTGADRII